MTPEVYEAVLVKPWPSTVTVSLGRAQARRAAMRQVLERYVLGNFIRLNDEMKELGSMKTDPAMQGFWEFRSGKPIEETRLFGFFARPGAFVALSFQPRGKFGGASDPAWLAEKQACDNLWANLFGSKKYLKSPWPVQDRAIFLNYLNHADD